jgi:hypothetical protein
VQKKEQRGAGGVVDKKDKNKKRKRDGWWDRNTKNLAENK